MDIQTLIVALVIVAALVYAGNSVRVKVAASRGRAKSCGNDCGCGK